MGFKFGRASRENLETCEERLVRLGEEAIATSPIDFSCTEGYRDLETQMKKFAEGKSKVTQGKHNVRPSHAVHFVPYPIIWPRPGEEPVMDTVKAYARFYMLAMHIRATAERLGINIRWGGDWDGDYDITDQNFDDLSHWEIET